MIRTRFAPSPTGYLHIGGARTALFNWLFARHHGGRFVLRIEDTDAARNTAEADAAIVEGLRWLGLDWDEGPDAGGSYGPYRQSERRDIYDKWFEKLREAGRVYEDNGTWRFAFERRAVTVEDLVAGPVTMDYADESNTPDMVVRRRDGSYIFHFVNVVDDLEMNISHVIRGDDHLSNTHKHVQLFEALGAAPPAFAHIPLILNAEGGKMSKRDRGASLDTYHREGFVPDGVVNFLALLGWSPKDDTEVFSRDELARRFSLDGVARHAATFDLAKCRWFSGRHLHQMEPGALAEAAAPHVAAAGVPAPAPDVTERVYSLLREKAQTLSELPPLVALFTQDDLSPDAAALEKASHNPTFADTAAALRGALERIDEQEWGGERIQAAIADVAAALSTKPGKLMFPLRLLATGKTGGPDLLPLLEILGRHRACDRLARMETSLVSQP